MINAVKLSLSCPGTRGLGMHGAVQRNAANAICGRTRDPDSFYVRRQRPIEIVTTHHPADLVGLAISHALPAVVLPTWATRPPIPIRSRSAQRLSSVLSIALRDGRCLRQE